LHRAIRGREVRRAKRERQRRPCLRTTFAGNGLQGGNRDRVLTSVRAMMRMTPQQLDSAAISVLQMLKDAGCAPVEVSSILVIALAWMIDGRLQEHHGTREERLASVVKAITEASRLIAEKEGRL
jgi:hypothetical protein